MKNKKIILTAAGFLCCSLIAVISAVSGTTTAYLSDHVQVNNQFTIGNNTTTVEEEFPTPTPVPPGESVVKKVCIENQGEVPCYIRVALSYSEDIISLEGLDTVNWVDGNDGYYYYKKVVEVGETTTKLFTGVSIDQEAENTNINVNVFAESVQAADGSIPYKDYKDAWAHYEGGE